MKKLIGVLSIVCGIAFGAYVGGWLCFIGGIVQVIEQIRAVTLVPLEVAFGIAKVIFAGVAFGLTAMCFIIPGFKLLASSHNNTLNAVFFKNK